MCVFGTVTAGNVLLKVADPKHTVCEGGLSKA
jgi:hypothetical protein